MFCCFLSDKILNFLWQNNVMDLWSLFDFLMPGFLGTERQVMAPYRCIFSSIKFCLLLLLPFLCWFYMFSLLMSIENTNSPCTEIKDMFYMLYYDGDYKRALKLMLQICLK